MDIPYIGKFFTTTTTDTITTEVVLTLTPKVVRNVTTPDLEHQAFWSGTEGNYATVPLFTDTSRAQPTKTSFKLEPVPAMPATPLPDTLGQAAPPARAEPIAVSDQVGGGLLSLQPPRFMAFVGQEFAVDVVADRLDHPTGATVTLTYDPALLEFRRVVDGALVNPGGADPHATVMAMRGAGEIELRLGSPDKPITGSGVLGTLLFKAKAIGKVPVEIQMPGGGTGEAMPPRVLVARGEILVR
jgi:general secretion pathway protein D